MVQQVYLPWKPYWVSSKDLATVVVKASHHSLKNLIFQDQFSSLMSTCQWPTHRWCQAHPTVVVIPQPGLGGSCATMHEHYSHRIAEWHPHHRCHAGAKRAWWSAQWYWYNSPVCDLSTVKIFRRYQDHKTHFCITINLNFAWLLIT